MKVLVVGASGMIGSAVLSVLSGKSEWEVFGTVRHEGVKRYFTPEISGKLVPGVDLDNHDQIVRVFSSVRPDVVVNCAGLTKHRPEASDPLASIALNSLMPHRLAGICKLSGARLIHVSTDCVFSGDKGSYTENDLPDATDVYGRSKILGEVDYEHAITLRTSTIGHEFCTKLGLLEWFLSQEGECSGFKKAIFSGLPTSVFAEVIRDYVIPNQQLTGLYHVSAAPIDKFTLLNLIAEAYEKEISIVPDERLVIDRSLDGSRFETATGYSAPDWPRLIRTMRTHSMPNV
ncbi:SDR family oxidoreductase [Verrucomicrobiales bacterium]|nr:SDR family oxidoreductase [Verrucomicrobiales bacterium]MDA7926711.1 SDR family oxidoreductase [Verrucomicrobiales bacterium]MDB4358914.1 SDR family oxidoreductase [Verrucomicrobiales bacterium]